MLHIAMGCYRHYGSTVLPYYISLHITTVVNVSATCYYHHYGTTVLPYYIALHITTVVKVSATCHYKQGAWGTATELYLRPRLLVLPKFSSELIQRTRTNRTEPKILFCSVL